MAEKHFSLTILLVVQSIWGLWSFNQERPRTAGACGEITRNWITSLWLPDNSRVVCVIWARVTIQCIYSSEWINLPHLWVRRGIDSYYHMREDRSWSRSMQENWGEEVWLIRTFPLLGEPLLKGRCLGSGQPRWWGFVKTNGCAEKYWGDVGLRGVSWQLALSLRLSLSLLSRRVARDIRESDT